LNSDFDPFLKQQYNAGNQTNFLTVQVPQGTTKPLAAFSSYVYKGNTVSDAQAIVGKAILDGTILESASKLNTRLSTFNAKILTWIAGVGSTLGTYINSGATGYPLGFICNGDETFRVQVGVVGFRIASTWGSVISHNHVSSAINHGYYGDSYSCNPAFNNDTRSNPNAVLTGYTGADARGFAFASVQGLAADHNFAGSVQSWAGSVFGFDVLTDSNGVYLVRNEVRGSTAGMFFRSAAIPSNYYDGTINPTAVPVAVGFHVDQRAQNVIIDAFCVNTLYADEDHKGPSFKASMPNSTTDSEGKYPKEWSGCHTGDEAWWLWLILGIVCVIFLVALVAVLMALMDGGAGGAGQYKEMRE